MKKEIKLSLFVDNMIVYIENLKHSTIRKLVSEKQGLYFNICIQKSYIPQQTKWKLLDNNICNIIQKTRCLEINLTKCEQDLYIENYVTLLWEIKEFNKQGYTMSMDPT